MTATFTPEDVRKAYIEKGMKPIKGVYGIGLDASGTIISKRDDRSCCALGALLIGQPCPASAQWMHDGNLRWDVGAVVRDLLGVGSVSFWTGFDWHDGPHIPSQTDDDEDFKLGRACWEAVKDLAAPGVAEQKGEQS